jgi:drug/metabolite transporter (DMT)-like permease
MLAKLLIILILIAILGSLAYGLYTLVVDRGESTRTVKALTVRVSLSVGLFFLLLILFATGLIKPHGGPGSLYGAPPAGAAAQQQAPASPTPGN